MLLRETEALNSCLLLWSLFFSYMSPGKMNLLFCDHLIILSCCPVPESEANTHRHTDRHTQTHTKTCKHTHSYTWTHRHRCTSVASSPQTTWRAARAEGVGEEADLRSTSQGRTFFRRNCSVPWCGATGFRVADACWQLPAVGDYESRGGRGEFSQSLLQRQLCPPQRGTLGSL